jgi:exopolyphosphatase/guanosine-5'-triphosphate,3'-diphosphate pyrophosphatase
MIPHSRLLLEVSAVLHDIGTYIRTSGHHKHGQYIIANSEVFGLNRHDISIVSNVVRYHRKASPMPSHSSYISLAREDRVRVMKLASILRVADALDRSHTQRISIKGIEKKDGMLIVKCEYSGDISIERMGLSRKANMFEEIFGMTVGLV